MTPYMTRNTEEVVYTIGKSVMENYDVKKVIFYVDDKEIVEY